MKWFRSNIKLGSRLALFALAVQFALSSGHFHGIPAQAAPEIQSGRAVTDLSYVNGLPAPDAVSESAQQQSPSNHDADQQPNEPCAICAVIAQASATLFATPPLLLLPQAVEFLHLTTGGEFVHLNSGCVAFRPRAPPIS